MARKRTLPSGGTGVPSAAQTAVHAPAPFAVAHSDAPPAQRRIGTSLSVWGSAFAIAREAIRKIEEMKKAAKRDKRPLITRILTEYQKDILGFVRDICGITLLSPKQKEILEACMNAREISVSSGNGVGKTFLLPIVAWWTFLCWEESLVTFGSSVDRQIRINHWTPLRRIWNNAPYKFGPKPGKQHLSGYTSDDDKRIIFGASPKQKDDVQGTRSKRTVVLLDESAGIPDDVSAGYDNLMTGENSFRINMGNPTATSGWFREKFAKNDGTNPRVLTFEISCLDSLNVIERREVIPGLTSHTWVEERRKLWGEDDPRWIVSVLGRFLSNEETKIFPDQYLENLWDPSADFDAERVLRIGIDLAEYGGDRTIAYYVRGMRAFDREDLTGMDYEQIALHIVGKIGEEKALIHYDATGIGRKFGRAFEHTKHELIGVHYGQHAEEKDTYKSARDEMPWHLKQWIRMGGKILFHEQAESMQMLKKEMQTAKFTFNTRRQILSNEKDTIRKSLGRSCDDYDALCLALYNWETTAAQMIASARKKKEKQKPQPKTSTGFAYNQKR